MFDWRQIEAIELHRAELLRGANQAQLAQLARAGAERPARQWPHTWLGRRLTAWGERLQGRARMAGPRLVGAQNGAHDGSVIARLMVFSGEVYRLPAEYHGMRVVAGKAWVTHASR